MIDPIWYYTAEGGRAAYWRNPDEQHLYTPNGRNDFWESDGYWYRVSDGRPAFYLGDDRQWVYSMDGKPAFYRAD